MMNELQHYGVKGMKWGVRRAARKERNASYRKAHESFQRDLKKLQADGKGNDNSAVIKRAAQYDVERNAAKAKYKERVDNDFDVRDVRKARKDVKAAFKSGNRSNYEKVSRQQGALLNKTGYTDRVKAETAFANARRAVKEAMLLDAGYSPEKAKKGAEWFESHNWNITFTDNHRLYDYIDDVY